MRPGIPRFRQELAAIPPAPFAATCFRVVELEAFLNAATPALLFDWGPKFSRYGQRFSPPDSHRGLYVSTEVLTAGSEFADGRAAWLAGTRTKHIVFDLDVRLNAVLDLTLASAKRSLRTSRRELQAAWLGFAELNAGAWPATWLLGEEAFRSGRFDGILFPSTKNPQGSCLLIFTERLAFSGGHVILHRRDGTVWERLP